MERRDKVELIALGVQGAALVALYVKNPRASGFAIFAVSLLAAAAGVIIAVVALPAEGRSQGTGQ